MLLENIVSLNNGDAVDILAVVGDTATSMDLWEGVNGGRKVKLVAVVLRRLLKVKGEGEGQSCVEVLSILAPSYP